MNEFERLKAVLPQSGCAKKQVACGTYVNGEWRWQVNKCIFAGSTCPRINLPSGVGYDLCEALHAEARLVAARLVAELKQEGVQSDGIAWVFSHYWACEPCASSLKSIGVQEIRVREICPENGQING